MHGARRDDRTEDPRNNLEEKTMAQRSTERQAQGGAENMATQTGAESAAAQSGETGAMHRRGGPLTAGPFSLIDWMLDRLQRDFFGSASTGAAGMHALSQPGGGNTRIPRLNVTENDNEIVVTAEVPGVDPKDVQIEVDDDVVTLRAEARETREDDASQVISYTRFFTQLPVPDDIDAEDITASSRNGVVTLRFPKQQQARSARRIPVSAGEGEQGGASQQQQQQRAA
jgi:HSP20 family protein